MIPHRNQNIFRKILSKKSAFVNAPWSTALNLILLVLVVFCELAIQPHMLCLIILATSDTGCISSSKFALIIHYSSCETNRSGPGPSSPSSSLLDVES